MSLASRTSRHKVTIEVERVVPGGGMGTIRKWVTQEANRTCLVRLKGALPPIEAHGKSEPKKLWTVIFSVDPVIQEEKNRLRFKDKAGVTHLLMVKSVTNAHDMDRMWRVECEDMPFTDEKVAS